MRRTSRLRLSMKNPSCGILVPFEPLVASTAFAERTFAVPVPGEGWMQACGRVFLGSRSRCHFLLLTLEFHLMLPCHQPTAQPHTKAHQLRHRPGAAPRSPIGTKPRIGQVEASSKDVRACGGWSRIEPLLIAPGAQISSGSGSFQTTVSNICVMK